MAVFAPSSKQHECFQLLTQDNGVTEILYGGAAGGGKSYVGAAWIIISAMKYPGTRWLVGRERLTDIKNSILVTFVDLLKKWGVKYNLNQAELYIKLGNESMIIFKELCQRPGDKDFDRLGSTEITGAFIEEAAQVSQKAAQVVTSRIRYRNDEYKIPAKLLMTCNPTKGWLYSEFYMPSNNGTLPSHRVYLKALLADNSNSSESYRETYRKQLEKLDPINRKRLLAGDWDYDDSDQDIFNWESINACFHRSCPNPKATHITVDPAHYGADKTAIILWADLHVLDIIILIKKNTAEIADEVKRLRDLNGINNSDIAVDIDGVGAGVKDQISPFVIGIHNGGSVFRQENYRNLKSQMYFKLAEKLDEISFAPKLMGMRPEICQEIYAHKRTKIDDDQGKLEITKKDKVRQELGRSPDLSDAIAFRMYYEVRYSTKFKTKFY